MPVIRRRHRRLWYWQDHNRTRCREMQTPTAARDRSDEIYPTSAAGGCRRRHLLKSVAGDEQIADYNTRDDVEK